MERRGRDGESIRLAGGASTPVRLRAGSRVRLVDGSVRLSEPPATLDGVGAQTVVRLRPGDVHRIARSGWAVLTAGERTHLVVFAPPRAPRPERALRAAAARLAQRARPGVERALRALASALAARGRGRAGASTSRTVPDGPIGPGRC